MIQIMQQLQIGNQSMGQALSQQQEQLNQQREASQQQMQRLETMVTNISQRGSGGVDVGKSVSQTSARVQRPDSKAVARLDVHFRDLVLQSVS